jgi:hypothetical protein
MADLKNLNTFEGLGCFKEVQLKVCATCISWLYTHGGYCKLHEKAAGRFWSCENWTSPEEFQA